MKIRRYLAKDNQEAILKVKMDLGSDAVILNTRKVKKKGIVGLFSKPMVEVLAAIDEYNKSQTDDKAQAAGYKYDNGPEKIDQINLDEKEEKIAKLENKIVSIEQMFRQYIQQNPNAAVKPANEWNAKCSGKIFDTFYNNLIKNDVEPNIAREIVNKAESKLGSCNDVNRVAVQISNIIKSTLGQPEMISPGSQGKPRIVIFIGPTGVGKTTTLAKIAANCLLSQKKTIGLITADTYRIAAVEQLKTYAEILGIPVSVAYTAMDIKEAVNQNMDKDLILIDTAGRSHKNHSQFEELKTMVTASEADEIYLVLSATTSIRNCKDILESYNFLRDYKLIFTKVDEAQNLGIILNVRYITGKCISYVTNGQSVPDDIEMADTDKITRDLIGSIV
jgi:flagellar biosynthesis protein FlhF